MDHDEGSSNPSSNRTFQDVLTGYASRRQVMKGGLTLAAGTFFGSSLALAAKGGKPGPNGPTGQNRKNGLINFRPVPVAEGTGPMPSISADYHYEVLIPWGTSLDNAVADYLGDPDTRPSAAQQAQQVGIGHDGMWFFPFRGSNTRGLLAINHEFGGNGTVLGKAAPESVADVNTSQHAHGISVVEIRKQNGSWKLVKGSEYNRRVHVNTPVTFSGPVAGSDLIASDSVPKGTVNNCANGYTPWGTYLTCEENFNGYFNDTTGEWAATPEQTRYGFSANGFGYGWGNFDERFNLGRPHNSAFRNEENRFGWIVEVDPFNPDAIPVKRTALGRCKHEGIAIVEGRGGRIVGYMGDDERFDYIYKFVSESNWKSMRAQGMSPLDHGTLYAAKFNDDGSGDWLELSPNNPALAGMSLEEILTFARVAADKAGATPMDRPEWTAVAPNGDVYCALTNNSRRTVADAANPLAPNADGHIIRWHDSDQHTGLSFTWDIFIIAQDTHADGDERTFSDPDGIWIDPDGRIFIQTDGGQKKGLNNQMVVASTYDSGPDLDVRRLFAGVTGDEITGIAVTPDRRTMFINTQHPGDGNPVLSNFPAAFDGVTIPRDCTIVITRKDGGIIGS